MAQKIKLELTEFQFSSLISVIDTCSALMEEDEVTIKEIKTIDAMLKKNGYRRVHS